MEISEFATVPEASRLCDIGQASIQRAIDGGNIDPHETAGGTVLVKVADVHRWVRVRPGRGRPRKPAQQ